MTEFYPKSKNGRQNTYCKPCHKIYVKEHRNPEKQREYSKKYCQRDEIKQKIKERQKTYRENNREKTKDLCSKWRKANSEKNRESQKRHYNKTIKNISNSYCDRMLKQRGYTKEQIEQNPELLDIKKIQIIVHRAKKIKPKNNETEPRNNDSETPS